MYGIMIAKSVNCNALIINAKAKMEFWSKKTVSSARDGGAQMLQKSSLSLECPHNQESPMYINKSSPQGGGHASRCIFTHPLPKTRLIGTCHIHYHKTWQEENNLREYLPMSTYDEILPEVELMHRAQHASCLFHNTVAFCCYKHCINVFLWFIWNSL